MKHLDETGETYGEHLLFAARVGLLMVFAGLAAIVHAICPWWFSRTGSNAIQTLNAMLEIRRRATKKTDLNMPAGTDQVNPED